MTKTEREVVNTSKPKSKFEKWNKTKIPDMKYTVQVKPEIFIGTKIVYCNDVITTEVKRNERKLPIHWS